MKIEVSNGELIDKLSILEIKAAKIHDPDKKKFIVRELNLLREAADLILPICQKQYAKLLEVNGELWEIEDLLRKMEKEARFDSDFVAAARSVYLKNDLRASIKKEINQLTSSFLSEEKSYSDYA